MSSPTELHFDGARPRLARGWILLIAIGVIGLLAMFAVATLPKQRSELVGRWQNTVEKSSYYVFQANGNFTAEVTDTWVGSVRYPKGKYQGKWKADAKMLYLTAEKVEPIGKHPNLKHFQIATRERIGKQVKIPLEWSAPDQWSMSYQANQQYKKVAK